jgi:predicted hydrolase (HD superfamily)
MNAPLDRTQWINLRTQELLLDDEAVPDLIDQIMRHGGLASRALMAHLRGWFYGETVFIREQAADQATNIVGAFAFMRAQREYDGKPLVP